MFKKLKDKLAEEVKSSPQRIQQFAQAAQAAVTSASSSISDITNSDLFSIGDNDASSKSQISSNQQNNLQELPLVQPGMSQNVEPMDYNTTQEIALESQRQRRLSNSSLASDISFRLPSYESPSMYHLQSDMEVSASEAEDRGFSSDSVNLDRVTKQQVYSAYRRTQDRCRKYKTQYADLARHYKLLERENAKAKNVLVETQDKALRRISELREQCSLEQSAKAHLEKALRVEIEEKNMKIETLNTKLNILQSSDTTANNNLIENNKQTSSERNDIDFSLINLNDNMSVEKVSCEDSLPSEITILNNKVEKMEQLLNKYKDSLKTTKEKNTVLTVELRKISNELDIKVKENEQLQITSASLLEAKKQIEELKENLEDLQNKNNSNEFLKNKEMSILEINLKNAQEEILQMHKKIDILSKREEEYAISLAENKLSIHKELEGKENEIKSLKESLNNSQNEIQSVNIIINDYKNKITQLEDENSKLKNDINELHTDKIKIIEVKNELEIFANKCHRLESLINKSDEEYKCLELQMKQENAEKLAMIDRNVYLENRIAMLLEDNAKKNSQINSYEQELQSLKNNIESLKNQLPEESKEIKKYIEELNEWKSKCSNLECEIQDERVELVKLQSEIEKLLANHELIQNCNENLNITVNDLNIEIGILKNKLQNAERFQINCEDLKLKVNVLRNILGATLGETKTFKELMDTSISVVKDNITVLNETAKQDLNNFITMCEDLQKHNTALENKVQKMAEQYNIVKNELHQKDNKTEDLQVKLKELELENSSCLKEMQQTKDELKTSQNELNNIIVELANVNESLRLCNDERDMLKSDLNKVSGMYSEMLNNFEELSKENNTLLELKEVTIKQSSQIKDLEKRVEDLTEENTSLKKLSDTISNNVIHIELELKDVQKSHSQIEAEKDNLIKIIDNLEKNSAANKQLNSKTIQTDLVGTYIDDELAVHNKTIKMLQEEMNLLKEINTQLLTQNEHNSSTIDNTNELLRQRNIEFDTLKDDNRRLQSDIEGLQTHITKVSKENSKLNDTLRESLASNLNIPDKGEILSQDLETLKIEIQSGKEKLESLIRENSLLAEENLELKDQIQSQSYPQLIATVPIESSAVENVMDKYNALLDTKNRLEKKLGDLEVTNQSINENMLLMQANNDKLKLSNEKLGLRLDEALVSLRHLHALQENTELEYLKNILYEYLTGTGVHSITLAKVLAAVVKFDDRQTDLVLQKEKERQGFLRQLGII